MVNAMGFFAFREDSVNTNTISRRPLGGKSNKDPVRLTALLYLREALQLERYEDCKDIIAIAYEFGATENDIHFLLEDARRKPS